MGPRHLPTLGFNNFSLPNAGDIFQVLLLAKEVAALPMGKATNKGDDILRCMTKSQRPESSREITNELHRH
jgi:hypothetical protein